MILTLGLVALRVPFGAIVGQAAKQAGPATATAPSPHPDLSGVWILNPTADASSFANLASGREEPPMTPWGQEKYRSAKPVFGPNKKPPQESNDPVYGCFPPGVPRIYLQQRPMEIVQLQNEVIIAYQYDRLVRHIYTDGRAHDDFIDPPLWMGDSIGKWEDGALVVDAIGFNDKTWLDRVGHPHSDALDVIERFRRLDHGTLVDDITIEDPKAYTKAWTTQLRFQLKPGAEISWEEVCEDEKLRDRQ